MPKVEKLRGARKGLTVEGVASSALHFTTAGGQVWRGHGAHGGHLEGSGHFTSGQRARGQGGHSPFGLLHLLQSKITGICLGMDDLRTYWERSGTGGHSVFNIYWLRSGHCGQGGIVDFNTYLLRSGSRHGGQDGQTGRGLEHPQGFDFPHELHSPFPPDKFSKPSLLVLFKIAPIITPKTRANTR